MRRDVKPLSEKVARDAARTEEGSEGAQEIPEPCCVPTWNVKIGIMSYKATCDLCVLRASVMNSTGWTPG
jgi:hypothetical protein